MLTYEYKLYRSKRNRKLNANVFVSNSIRQYFRFSYSRLWGRKMSDLAFGSFV